MLFHRLLLLTAILVVSVKLSIVDGTFVTPSIIGSTNSRSSKYSNRILSSYQTKSFYHHHHHHLTSSSSLSDQSIESSDNSNSINSEQQKSQTKKCLTNAIFKIGYDGTNFHGWSAANDGAKRQNHHQSSSTKKSSHNNIDDDNAHHLPPVRGRSRRNKNRPSGGGTVRSVQGAIRASFARIYGDVDPIRVRVEGCSRTDGGVHANGMIAMVYCISDRDTDGDGDVLPQQLYHPSSSEDDSYFLPLPFDSDLRRIAWVMNKMLPPDVRILDASTTPITTTMLHHNRDDDDDGPTTHDGTRPFHPSLDTEAKTYRYTFSLGDYHDPTRCRNIWHANKHHHQKNFNLSATQTYASTFLGTHDFKDFQGTAKGSGRGKVRNSTICTIFNMTIVEEGEEDGDGEWCVDAFSPPDVNAVRLYAPSSSSPLSMTLSNIGFGQGGNGGSTTIPPTSIDGIRIVPPITSTTRPACRTFCITVTGDRFLYKMVRFIVGAIVTFGVEEAGEILNDDTKDEKDTDADHQLESTNTGEDSHRHLEESPRWHSQRRVCAPAHGLSLDDVRYAPDWQFLWNSNGAFHDEDQEYRRRKSRR